MSRRSARALPVRCGGSPAGTGNAHEEVAEALVEPLDVRQNSRAAHGAHRARGRHAEPNDCGAMSLFQATVWSASRNILQR